MKKNKKIIKFLKSVKNYDTLSKYSLVLEKLFNKKCVEGLIKSLKMEKIITDEDVFNSKFEKKETLYPENKSDNINQKNLLEYTYEDYLQEQQEKEKEMIEKNIKKEPWSIGDKSPRTPIIKEAFDSYKYHPNYDMIYKRVPSFSFLKSSKQSKKGENAIRLKSCSKVSKSRNTIKEKTGDPARLETEINIKKKKNKKKFFPYLTSIDYKYYYKKNKTENKKNEIKKRPNSHYNDNHCFNFKHYTSRKPMIYATSNNFSYIKPFNYFKISKQIVNYKKMIPRKDKDLIYAHRVDNPSMWQYSPKYDCIEPNQRKIFFNPNTFKETEKFNKIKRLKRAITSYEISSDYLSVDNSKLGKIEYI
jgi:hypothetical protein